MPFLITILYNTVLVSILLPYLRDDLAAEQAERELRHKLKQGFKVRNKFFPSESGFGWPKSLVSD